MQRRDCAECKHAHINIFTLSIEIDTHEQTVYTQIYIFVQQFLDALSGSKMGLFKFQNKYGKDLRPQKIYGKYCSVRKLHLLGRGLVFLSW